MIFCKILVFLCVACAVFAFDESSEVSNEDTSDLAEEIPVNATESVEVDVETEKVTEASTSTEPSVETELPVVTELPIQAEYVHPSSAQLQVNKTETSHQIGVSTCMEDTTCADIQNAYCKEGYCHCQQSFIPHPTNGSVCIKKAEKIGDKCEIAKQCEDVVGICSNGVCIQERIESAKIPLSNTINAASSVLSGSFFILSVTSLFLVN